MADAGVDGERELRKCPHVLQRLDTDLLYGFELAVTESTLRNFMARYPPPKEWAEWAVVYEKTTAQMSATEKEDKKKYGKKEVITLLKISNAVVAARNRELFKDFENKKSSGGWRMSSMYCKTETTEEQQDRLRSINPYLEGKEDKEDAMLKWWNWAMDLHYVDCVRSDPQRALEYQERVRNASLGAKDFMVTLKQDGDLKMTFTKEDFPYMDQRKRGQKDSWKELKRQGTNGHVDSALMQMVYAQWENGDLDKNMRTCTGFSADAQADSDVTYWVDKSVNPWSWMRNWLEGKIDGVVWGDLGTELLQAIYKDKKKADGLAAKEFPLEKGKLVRALYPRTEHFIAATLIGTNAVSGKHTVQFNVYEAGADPVKETHEVDADDVLGIPHPEAVNACRIDPKQGSTSLGLVYAYVENGMPCITAVVPGSCAMHAGILINDRIESVVSNAEGETDVTGLPVVNLTALLEQTWKTSARIDTKMVLKIQRSGTAVTAELDPASVLPVYSRAAWQTHHTRRMSADLAAEGVPSSRFFAISPESEFKKADHLSMLMMDAFREELHRRCERRVRRQCACLREWFGLGLAARVGPGGIVESPAIVGVPLVFNAVDTLAVTPTLHRFLRYRYEWCIHQASRERAHKEILDRYVHATERARAFVAALPRGQGIDLFKEEVYTLIDDVIATEFEYNMFPKRKRYRKFIPWDWGAEFPVLGDHVKALHPKVSDDLLVLPEKCRVTAAREFKRLKKMEHGDSRIMLCEVPKPHFEGQDENPRNREAYMHKRETPWHASRVRHGECTFNVSFESDEAPATATNLHASMLQPLKPLAPPRVEAPTRVEAAAADARPAPEVRVETEEIVPAAGAAAEVRVEPEEIVPEDVHVAVTEEVGDTEEEGEEGFEAWEPLVSDHEESSSEGTATSIISDDSDPAVGGAAAAVAAKPSATAAPSAAAAAAVATAKTEETATTAKSTGFDWPKTQEKVPFEPSGAGGMAASAKASFLGAVGKMWGSIYPAAKTDKDAAAAAKTAASTASPVVDTKLKDAVPSPAAGTAPTAASKAAAGDPKMKVTSPAPKPPSTIQPPTFFTTCQAYLPFSNQLNAMDAQITASTPKEEILTQLRKTVYVGAMFVKDWNTGIAEVSSDIATEFLDADVAKYIPGKKFADVFEQVKKAYPFFLHDYTAQTLASKLYQFPRNAEEAQRISTHQHKNAPFKPAPQARPAPQPARPPAAAAAAKVTPVKPATHPVDAKAAAGGSTAPARPTFFKTCQAYLPLSPNPGNVSAMEIKNDMPGSEILTRLGMMIELGVQCWERWDTGVPAPLDSSMSPIEALDSEVATILPRSSFADVFLAFKKDIHKRSERQNLTAHQVASILYQFPRTAQAAKEMSQKPPRTRKPALPAAENTRVAERAAAEAAAAKASPLPETLLPAPLAASSTTAKPLPEPKPSVTPLTTAKAPDKAPAAAKHGFFTTMNEFVQIKEYDHLYIPPDPEGRRMQTTTVKKLAKLMLYGLRWYEIVYGLSTAESSKERQDFDLDAGTFVLGLTFHEVFQAFHKDQEERISTNRKILDTSKKQTVFDPMLTEDSVAFMLSRFPKTADMALDLQNRARQKLQAKNAANPAGAAATPNPAAGETPAAPAAAPNPAAGDTPAAPAAAATATPGAAVGMGAPNPVGASPATAGAAPSPGGGDGAAAEFFTRCNALHLALDMKQNYIPPGLMEEAIVLPKLVGLMLFGAHFHVELGWGIPHRTAGDETPRPELMADVCKFTSNHSFTDVFNSYQALCVRDNIPTFTENQVAWMLDQFPKTTEECIFRLAHKNEAELLADYRDTITFEQCAWLEADLLQFGALAGEKITPTDLMTRGTYPFQDAVLHILHMSADAENDTDLDDKRFSVADAVWLALHLNENPEDVANDDFQRVYTWTRAHCAHEYNYTAVPHRAEYTKRLTACTTPGQLLRASNAPLEMHVSQYRYAERPLFRRGIPNSSVDFLRAAREMTNPLIISGHKPSPSASVLQMWYEANCGCGQYDAAKLQPDYWDVTIMFPTRRPWSHKFSRGLFLSLTHAVALRDKWPRNARALRDHVSLSYAMSAPCIVSSMWYMAHLDHLRRTKTAAAAGGPPPYLYPLVARAATGPPPGGGGGGGGGGTPPGGGGGGGGGGARGGTPPPPPPPYIHVWPAIPIREIPVTFNGMMGGIINQGSSCYASSLFQVYLRSRMMPLFLAKIRAAMRTYTSRLEAWWALNRAEHKTIVSVATITSCGHAKDAGYARFPVLHELATWVYICTDMRANGIEFEKNSRNEPCMRRFYMFEAGRQLHELVAQMQVTPSSTTLDYGGVSILGILTLLYNAGRGSPAGGTPERRTLFNGGGRNHDSGEFMLAVADVMHNVQDWHNVLNFMVSDCEYVRTCDLCATSVTEPVHDLQLLSTVSLTDEIDNPVVSLKTFLDTPTKIEVVCESVTCDKGITNQSRTGTTRYGEVVCFYIAERQDGPQIFAGGDDPSRRLGGSGIANPNIYRTTIPQYLDLHHGVGEGTETYELIAVIHHRAAHYLAYVKVDDDWILYNDRDVSKSDFAGATTGVATARQSPHLIFYQRVPGTPEVGAAAGAAAARAARGADAARAADAAAARAAADAARGKSKPTGEGAIRAGAADMLRGFATATPHARASTETATARPAPGVERDMYMGIKKRRVPDLSRVSRDENQWKARQTVMREWVNKHKAVQAYYNSLDTNDDGSNTGSKVEKKRFWVTMEKIIKAVQMNVNIPKRVAGGSNAVTTLSSYDIKTLMAYAFFGIFDVLSLQKHADGSDIQPRSVFSMTNLFHARTEREDMFPLPTQKISCIFGYFYASFCQGPTVERQVHFTRYESTDFSGKKWKEDTAAVMKKTTVYNTKYIEEVCDDLKGECWEVDFANRGVGGGVLGRGQVQEEIRFLQCPELIVCKLFMDNLEDNEVVFITNYKQFNLTEGYKASFKWVGIKETEEPELRRMIVMDARSFGIPEDACIQFDMRYINRDIHKAHAGFTTRDEFPISTGHWGCGAFLGNRQLKAVIQMLAAGMAGKDLHYCVLGEEYTEIKTLADAVRGKRVGDVYTLLHNLVEQRIWKVGFRKPELIARLFAEFCADCGKLRTVDSKP